MSTLAVNSITPANAGSETYFLPKAWVNFNGQGTVAIRDDGRVSSITDNAVGKFRINYADTQPSINYVQTGSASKFDANFDGNAHLQCNGYNVANFNTTTGGYVVSTMTTSTGGQDSHTCAWTLLR